MRLKKHDCRNAYAGPYKPTLRVVTFILTMVSLNIFQMIAANIVEEFSEQIINQDF